MPGNLKVIRTQQADWLKTVLESYRADSKVMIIDDALIGLKSEDLPDGVSIFFSRDDVISRRPRPWLKAALGILLLAVGALNGNELTTALRITPEIGLAIELSYAIMCALGLTIGISLIAEVLENERLLSEIRFPVSPRRRLVTSSILLPAVSAGIGLAMLQLHMFAYDRGFLVLLMILILAVVAKQTIHDMFTAQHELEPDRLGAVADKLKDAQSGVEKASVTQPK
jgi:hypothetical protein